MRDGGVLVYLYVNILVPPDIVPVKRTSPIKAKTRTAWRETAEGVPIEGGREWMSSSVVPQSRASELLDVVTAPWSVHIAAATALIAMSAIVAVAARAAL